MSTSLNRELVGYIVVQGFSDITAWQLLVTSLAPEDMGFPEKDVSF
jgi:hypothetical protein